MHNQLMRTSRNFIAVSLTIWSTLSIADPNVKFITPVDGAKVKGGESVVVKYEIVPNPGGDHSHIYINNKEAGVLRKQKGKYKLDPLPAGTHDICLKVVNRGHASIGQGTCIKIERI